MLFARCGDGGQPGSPSSLGIWKLHFFLYLMKAEAPQLRSSSWGGRFWEPRDLRDDSWLAGLESGQFLPACLKWGGGPSQVCWAPLFLILLTLLMS